MSRLVAWGNAVTASRINTKRPRDVCASGGMAEPNRRSDMAKGICSVEGCESIVGPKSARGYCAKHYARWKKHGDPLLGGRPERWGEGYTAIHEWINKTFPRIGRCEYCGQRKRTEYASIGHTYRRDRTEWCELCRRCHIWFDENPAGRAAAAMRRAKTHCPYGHPYDSENTYVMTNGGRACRECRRREGREAQRRKRATA